MKRHRQLVPPFALIHEGDSAIEQLFGDARRLTPLSCVSHVTQDASGSGHEIPYLQGFSLWARDFLRRYDNPATV
jgi:hypothetical protein